VLHLTDASQNKIENDASVDDLRRDEQEMQSILTHASSSAGHRISQELRDSIESLRRYLSLHLLQAICRSQLSIVNFRVICVNWNHFLERSLFIRAWV
jgi:hypothetical protein